MIAEKNDGSYGRLRVTLQVQVEGYIPLRINLTLPLAQLLRNRTAPFIRVSRAVTTWAIFDIINQRVNDQSCHRHLLPPSSSPTVLAEFYSEGHPISSPSRLLDK
jgi:hypothetical protein